MSTVEIAVRPYRLALRQPFVTAGGTHTWRAGLLVRVGMNGLTGYGEVAPLPGHSRETLAAASGALGRLASELVTLVAADDRGPPTAPRQLRRIATALAQRAPDAPAARAGLDLALADLAARTAGCPLAQWLNPEARPAVSVNAAVGAVAPEEAARLARAALARGFGTLKVKIGTDDAEDAARIAAVRLAVGPDIRLRGDANGAWHEAQALEMLRALAPYDLEYVEQPVVASGIGALARLRSVSPIPLAADEALLDPRGLERVLEMGAADVLVLKPTLIGGISAAWSWAQRATVRGLDVVITTALESAVGRAGAVHLAAALPDNGRAQGLATGELLAEDVAAGPVVASGAVSVPDGPGLGILPDADGPWETIARATLDHGSPC